MDPLYPIPYKHEKPSTEIDSAIFHVTGESALANETTLCPGRIASYDNSGAAPYIVEIQPGPINEFLGLLSSKTYELARGLGSTIPYTVIREIIENFIHADFSEPVISIFDNGQTLRFADQGPGIQEKDKAMLPGFTSATKQMKGYIRGVGSGLPIVSEFLTLHGGSFNIEDNMESGTVVTISSKKSITTKPAPIIKEDNKQPFIPHEIPRSLTTRQLKILALMVGSGPLGPTNVSNELEVSITTAHRDLEFLEKKGLVTTTEDRKRVISDKGIETLNSELR